TRRVACAPPPIWSGRSAEVILATGRAAFNPAGRRTLPSPRRGEGRDSPPRRTRTMLHQEVCAMFAPFFALAAVSPTRQAAFRTAVLLHLAIVAGGAWLVAGPYPRAAAPWLGHLLLIAGIVEGAALVGWRLTQLPKSQALEFLLVSPLRPRWVLLVEALVGLARLGLVTLAGLPVLVLLVVTGRIEWADLGPLLGM